MGWVQRERQAAGHIPLLAGAGDRNPFSTPRRSQAAIASSAHGNASPFCRCLCLYSRSTSGHGVDTTRAPGGRHIPLLAGAGDRNPFSTPRRSQAAIAFMRTRERRIPTSTKAKSLWHRFQTRIGPLLRLQFLHLHNCIASRRIWLQRRPRLTHCRLQALRASLFAAASEANIPQIAVCSRRTEGVPRQKSLAAHLPSLARKHKGAGAFAPAPVREPQPSTPATEIRVNSHVPSLSQKP